jgi:hypothetical protein
MAKKAYVNDGTNWVELASSITEVPDISIFLTNSSASNTYLTKASASTTYLTQTSASTTYATKTELANIDLSSASAAAVAAIVDSAPSTLNTLNELAAALGDDANYASTITTALGNKLDISTASSTYQTKVANVSDTEIGYLDGVTSGIQTQLNNKFSLDSPSFLTATIPILRLTATGDASTSSTDHAFQVGQDNSNNIRIDTNEILSFNNGVNATLNLQTDGGKILVANNVVDGSAVGLELHGPLRLESSRNAANNARGIDSMQAKIAVSSTNNRQELQIYSAGDAYSTGSRGAGIQMYGTDDSQHAGNISFLTGTPDNGDARMIIAGGTGTTGYVSGVTTYTRTNTDTRVTIGNSLWDWVDEKNDTGLLNLKDPSARPAIYVTSSGSTDGSTYGTIGLETGTNFGIGHWSGTAYTNRLSIDSTGIVSIPGILDVAEVRETVVSNSFSTNVMTANYNDGAIHYATVAPTGNFTISLTNVPTTTSKSITMSFLITQGSTGYIPTTINLNGSSQTIRWVGGSAPTPTSSAGKIDIFNFTLILAASNVVIASANLNI